MSMVYVGYKQVTNATAETVKSGPAKFFGLVVIASTAGTVDVYDATSATGNKLFSKTALAAGEIINFASLGIAAGNGLHVVVGGTATINVLYV